MSFAVNCNCPYLSILTHLLEMEKLIVTINIFSNLYTVLTFVELVTFLQ